MMLRVTRMEALTPDIRLIRLEDPNGSPLEHFEPGSHIELTFQCGPSVLSRKYSLVSDCKESRHYEIAVKRNANGRGGSIFLNDVLAVGDEVEVMGPMSEFRIARDAEKFILIAGGIGITPMLSIRSALEEAGLPYELHYSAKDEKQMAFRERFADRDLHSNHLYFTGENSSKRIDIAHLLDASVSHKNTHVYVCGPTKLIDSVRVGAEVRHIPEHRIHFESFGPGWDADDGTVTVSLTESGIEVEVAPGTTLLDALENAGAWIPSECRRGECGACITSYVGGKPIHRDSCLTPEQRETSLCPCVSWAAAGSVLKLQL